MNHLQHQMRDRWNEKGWQYDQHTAHGVHNHEDKDEWVQLFQALESGSHVLDIGAGTGFVTLLAAEQGHHVTAIDWSKTMLEQAKAKVKNTDFSVDFVEGMTESLPFEHNLFDAVTARHVLWTLSDPDQALTEWFRVLKPGGKVWADYSPREAGHQSHHYQVEVERQLPLNGDVSPDLIVKHFEDAGFSDIQVTKRERRTEEAHYAKTAYLFSCIKNV